MSPFDRFRWFQKTATAILVTFLGLIVLVIVVAYSRRSGNTGLDMAKIRLLRESSREISQK